MLSSEKNNMACICAIKQRLIIIGYNIEATHSDKNIFAPATNPKDTKNTKMISVRIKDPPTNRIVKIPSMSIQMKTKTFKFR